MPRKNIEKVIAAWLEGKAADGDHKKTCWTDGTSIFSYNTCIAMVEGHVGVVLNRTWYSKTTQSQQRAVEVAALKKFGSANIFYVENMDRGVQPGTLFEKARENKDGYYPQVKQILSTGTAKTSEIAAVLGLNISDTSRVLHTMKERGEVESRKSDEKNPHLGVSLNYWGLKS